MLSRWLVGSLGSVVAPDEKYEAEKPPSEDGERGLSSFWQMVAPDPNYEQKVKAASPPTSYASPLSNISAAAPPQDAFLSPTSMYKTDVQCIHCKKTTPVRMPRQSDINNGFMTPYPTNQTSQSEDITTNDTELNQQVLTAAKGFSESVMSPPAANEQRNKVFRLCASNKPLVGKLPKRLEKMLLMDQTLLTARAANLGQLAPDSMTPLMAAANAGNISAAQVILKVDQKSNHKGHLDRDLQGRTALHIAGENGHSEVVAALLKIHEGDATPAEVLVDLTGRTPMGRVLTSPNPKAKKNQSKLEQQLFSPEDISIFGSPRPAMKRETIYRSLDIVLGEADVPGYRVTMEDATCNETWHDEQSGQFYCLLGVCDGHGDQGRVSNYVANEIIKLIKIQTKQLGQDKTTATNWQKIWTDACLEVDRTLKETGMVGGSTAVLVLITKTEIVVANVGDSRCILVQQQVGTSNNDVADPATPPLVDESATPPLVNENESVQAEPDGGGGDKTGSESSPADAESENKTEAASSIEAYTNKSNQDEEDATTATTTQEAGAETEEVNNVKTPQKESEKASFLAVALSDDHKPNLEHEKERIEKAGMTVISESFTENGQNVTIHKVQKNSSNRMAVSRSFGDFEYKTNKELPPDEQAVIAVPEVRVHSRNAETDMYLVAACDGIWDVMSNEDVAKFIVEKAESTGKQEGNNQGGRLPAIGDSLLKECVQTRGSRDNCSVVLSAMYKEVEKFATGTIKGKALRFE